MRLNFNVSGRSNISLFIKGIWWLLWSGKAIIYTDLNRSQLVELLEHIAEELADGEEKPPVEDRPKFDQPEEEQE